MSALDLSAQPIIPGLGAPARQAAQDAATQRAQQAATTARQTQEAQASAAQAAHVQQKNQTEESAQTAAGDAVNWAMTPEYAGKSFADAPPEARQHFVDAYGNIAGEAPSIWNQAQRDVTGIPGIGVNLEPGQTAQSKVAGSNVLVGKPEKVPPIPKDPRESWQKPDENLIKQHRDAGLSPVDDNGNPKTAGQMTSEVNDYNTQHGILPQALQNYQDIIEKNFQSHPMYVEHAKLAQGAQNFFANYQQAQTDPNLANNMAVIDGFIKSQNPGGIVRQQTLKMYTDGQALLQKANAAYLAGHFEEGQKLTAPFVKEAGDVMKREMQAQNDQFNNTIGAGFKNRLTRHGIKDTSDIVSPLQPIVDGFNKQPAAAAQPASPERMALARQAITDPAASPEHKAAAKAILGIP